MHQNLFEKFCNLRKEVKDKLKKSRNDRNETIYGFHSEFSQAALADCWAIFLATLPPKCSNVEADRMFNTFKCEMDRRAEKGSLKETNPAYMLKYVNCIIEYHNTWYWGGRENYKLWSERTSNFEEIVKICTNITDPLFKAQALTVSAYAQAIVDRQSEISIAERKINLRSKFAASLVYIAVDCHSVWHEALARKSCQNDSRPNSCEDTNAHDVAQVS